MIHYNVWFSFRAGVDEAHQLEKARRLLEDFKSRQMIAGYRLLKNRAAESKTNMPPYHVIIKFADDTQFGLPFAEVERIGIRLGKHGAMIEHVDEFVVEIFEEI
jgi:uncharacterized protein DUF6614